MDQTIPPERRVELSQVHIDHIVSDVREHFSRWKTACDNNENRLVILGHSHNIQKAIAHIVRRNAWSPLIEEALRAIIGASANHNIGQGQWLAERHSAGAPHEINPAPVEGEISPVHQGSEYV